MSWTTRPQVKACGKVIVRNVTKGIEIETALDVSDRQRDMLLKGGLLNATKENA